jgi:hypothetical protein
VTILLNYKNLHNDVVDGNVDELDEEANEAHQAETNSCGHGNLLEFCKKFYFP